MADNEKNEITQSLYYKYFNIDVDVTFNDTVDALSECQRDNFEQVHQKIDDLTPSILKAISEFYFESYPAYLEGWSYGFELSKEFTQEELEKYLPKPALGLDLGKYIEPLTIYIPAPESCESGYFGIYFDCTWDINNSLGVIVKNWKVVRAGTGDIAFLF
jgi:hypothetical protein